MVTAEAVDLRDGDAVARAIGNAKPEWVFHLAAHGAYSWQTDRRRIIETNVIGTINVVDAAGRAGATAIVNAGSSSEYGDKDHAPSESEIVEPNSDYAVAKAAATHYVTLAAHRDGLPTCTLRLYSVFGPWEEPGRLIPALVVHALRGELPPLVDPAIARDFVYVDDVVDAFISAARDGVSPGEVFNVGSGVETTIGAAVEVTRQVFALDVEPQWGSMEGRAWDLRTWVSNPARIEAVLGWKPRVSFADGLARTAEWLREHEEFWPRYDVRA